MLRAAIVFFVIALIAILFGATGIAGVSMEMGKLVLMIFFALALISFLVGMVTGRNSKLLP